MAAGNMTIGGNLSVGLAQAPPVGLVAKLTIRSLLAHSGETRRVPDRSTRPARPAVPFRVDSAVAEVRPAFPRRRRAHQPSLHGPPGRRPAGPRLHPTAPVHPHRTGIMGHNILSRSPIPWELG